MPGDKEKVIVYIAECSVVPIRVLVAAIMEAFIPANVECEVIAPPASNEFNALHIVERAQLMVGGVSAMSAEHANEIFCMHIVASNERLASGGEEIGYAHVLAVASVGAHAPSRLHIMIDPEADAPPAVVEAIGNMAADALAQTEKVAIEVTPEGVRSADMMIGLVSKALFDLVSDKAPKIHSTLQ